MIDSLVFYFFLFLIGVSLGSFLNVVIDRWPNNKSIIKKKSHCEFCQKILAAIDLIPILSFLLLKAKCRYCHKKLSRQYPLVELTTGFFFVLTYFLAWHFPFLPFLPLTSSSLLLTSLFLLIITCYLILIFVIDLKYQIIIDDIINSAIIITIVYYSLILIFFNSLIPFSYIIQAFISSIIIAFFFRFLIFVSRGRGLGEGDVKLGFWLGLLLGFPKIIPSLFIGFVGGALVGLLLIFFGQKKLRDIVPFAPFLTVGAYVGIFLGNQIIRWYLEKFL